MGLQDFTLEQLRANLGGRSKDQVAAMFKGAGIDTDPTKSVDEQCADAFAQIHTPKSAPAPEAVPPVVAPVPPGPGAGVGTNPAKLNMLAPMPTDGKRYKIRTTIPQRIRAGRRWTNRAVIVHESELSAEQWATLRADKMIQIKAV